MKRIGITSLLAIMTAIPAFAAGEISDADGLLTGKMCVVDTLNTSTNESTANLEAIWGANTYSEPAGQYLLFENDTITQDVTCPAGSWCPGFTDQTFADATMGLNACPTGYTNSAAGTSSQNDCYNPGTATCSTRNPYSGANPTKVTSVTYGNATNGSASCKTFYGDTTTCVLDNTTACDITDIACSTGYHKTTVAGRFVPISELSSYNDAGNLDYFDYNKLNSDSVSDSGMTPGDWSSTWVTGTVITGTSTCVSTAGSAYPRSQLAADALTAGQYNDSDALYCWCRMDSYTLPGGSNIPTVGAWVFYSTLSTCASNCTSNCASAMAHDPVFAAALYSSYVPGGLECTANTINLNWYTDTVANGGTLMSVNEEAQQCTYDGAITLPSTNPTKTGYTFSGWRLRQ